MYSFMYFTKRCIPLHSYCLFYICISPYIFLTPTYVYGCIFLYLFPTPQPAFPQFYACCKRTKYHASPPPLQSIMYFLHGTPCSRVINHWWLCIIKAFQKNCTEMHTMLLEKPWFIFFFRLWTNLRTSDFYSDVSQQAGHSIYEACIFCNVTCFQDDSSY